MGLQSRIIRPRRASNGFRQETRLILKPRHGDSDVIGGFLGITGMAGEKSEKDSEEKRFNDTLKRMLETPPKPHEKEKASEKKSASRGDDQSSGTRHKSKAR